MGSVVLDPSHNMAAKALIRAVRVSGLFIGDTQTRVVTRSEGHHAEGDYVGR